MRVTPKSEDQIAREGLLPPGVYDFEIVGAENAVSKNGNDMIKLSLQVFDQDGNTRMVFDYLLEQFARKLRNAAKACGLLSRYEEGELFAIDFEGKTGKVKITVQEDRTGQFPPRNSVSDYVLEASVPLFGSTAAPQKSFGAPRNKVANEELVDEIPF